MTATTKELIDTLTKTLKNINQSPTIPLPVFKGKKGEDPGSYFKGGRLLWSPSGY